jgi:AmiR/NasT family two-component response regulator
MQNTEDIRVLIVEDDPLVSEMFHGLLQDMGYTIAGRALDGKEAVEMTLACQPDLVLMDLELSNIDGIEATRHISNCCPTPVVIVTAFETPELVKQASAAGASAYLVKPPDTGEIERAITMAIARFHDLTEMRRLNKKLQERNDELQVLLDKVKRLSGMLPICANCKKIRDDEGYWQDVAVYIREHSEAEFSHGLCPDCMQTLYPGPEKYGDISAQEISRALTNLGWATLAEIAAEVELTESSILTSLQHMMRNRQVKCIDVRGESYYKLL